MKQFFLIITLVLFSFNLLAQTPLRVVCVGNSITEGVGASSGQSYPAKLAEMLGNGYSVLNCGVSARTMLKKGNYPYWNEAKFADAKNFDPNIVIISLGTNDSKASNWVYKDEFYADYVAMVNEFRKNGKNPQIFVCLPPPAFKAAYSIRDSVILNDILPLVDSVAKTQNTSKIDYYHPLLPFGKLFPDGVHPCNLGAVYMAKIAYTAITGIAQPNIWKWDYTDEAIISSTIANLIPLTDNDENSVFEINPQGTETVDFEFPYKMYLNGCLFYSATDELTTSDWSIQFSNDKTIWTTSTATLGNPNNKGKVYTLSTSAARYFRLLLKGNKTLKINEFQFFGYPYIADKPATQYPDDLTGNIPADEQKGNFTASDVGLTDFGEISANAIDGLKNKYTVNGRNITMTYTFIDSVKVGSYSLAVGSASNVGRNPMSWRLYGAGSNLQYTLIAGEKSFSYPSVDYCNMKFPVLQPTEYLSYRIEIDGAGGENNTHISEWQLFAPGQLTDLHENFSYNRGLIADIKLLKNTIQVNTLQNIDGEYKIVNVSGKLFAMGKLASNIHIPLSSGIYVVRLESVNKIQTEKIVIQ